MSRDLRGTPCPSNGCFCPEPDWRLPGELPARQTFELRASYHCLGALLYCSVNIDMGANIRYSPHIHWALKMDFEQNDRDLIDHIIKAINELPDAHAVLNRVESQAIERHRLDAIIEAEIAGRHLVLLVEAKQHAFPRDVRHAVWQLRNHQAHFRPSGREVLPFLVSNAVSVGAREVLQSEGVGYADRSGSLYIPAQGAFVLIDRPPPSKALKVFDSIFQGSKARVLETVFTERDDWLSVGDVADKAEVSPATASATLSEM